MQHVVVLGLMGVGKTTTAMALADALGRPISDSDSELLAAVGHHGAEVAQRLGIPALHQIERGLLFMALARPTPQVIAAAASVVDDAEARRLLGDAFVVHIDADIDTIHDRQRAGDHRRHMSREELQELADRRRPLFSSVANIIVNGTNPIDQNVQQITTSLSKLEASP